MRDGTVAFAASLPGREELLCSYLGSSAKCTQLGPLGSGPPQLPIKKCHQNVLAYFVFSDGTHWALGLSLVPLYSFPLEEGGLPLKAWAPNAVSDPEEMHTFQEGGGNTRSHQARLEGLCLYLSVPCLELEVLILDFLGGQGTPWEVLSTCDQMLQGGCGCGSSEPNPHLTFTQPLHLYPILREINSDSPFLPVSSLTLFSKLSIQLRMLLSFPMPLLELPSIRKPSGHTATLTPS